MSWNISWYTANSFSPTAIAANDEVRFRTHSRTLFEIGKNIGLTSKTLHLLIDGAYNSAFCTAKERFSNHEEAQKYKEKFDSCFTNILQRNEISQDIVENIKGMFLHISWFCTNQRSTSILNMEHAKSDRTKFEYHFSQLASGKKKGTIFLCHASEDKPRVEEIREHLMNDGYYPWLDKEELLGGKSGMKLSETHWLDLMQF